jgi:CBS domain containing-hemolysin-like protein
MENLFGLAAVVLLVFANAFFVATEFALVSIRRSRIEEMARQGLGVARVLRGAVADLDRYIAGTQVGITLASLALGWLGEPALAHLLEPLFSYLPGGLRPAAGHALAVTVAFGLITFLHVVLGELVPKSLALQRTEATARFVARPMSWVLVTFQPLIWALNGTGNLILRWLGLRAAGEGALVHSVEELEILVRQSQQAGVLDELERHMLTRAFRFSERTAREVMVSRLDMVAVDIAWSPEEICDRVAASTHTRIPVYEGSVDHIIGILLLQDLFRELRARPENLEVRRLLREPLVVPASIHLDALLDLFRQHHTQIAILLDEYGGTAGLATLEDVVEEIFGEMQDELEAEQPAIQRGGDGRVLVRGDVRLDELNEALGWRLEDQHSDTLAGYVMDRLGRPATVGDTVETPWGTLRVEDTARLRVTRVAVLPGSSVKGEREDGR